MFEVIELNQSKNIMKSFNVIIYGTIRDIEEHFVKSFTNIELLSKFFNNVCIIIFENDSLDNTRNLLTSWASLSVINVKKHLILESNLNSSFPQRAHRLAYCRNKILQFIFNSNLDKQYQYAIHCDLDDRFWSLDYDSIVNCFQYDLNSWDAMFPINKNYSYYDFWALRCDQTWFNKNIFSCEIENNDNYNEYENHVSEFNSFLQSNKNSLISVNSAFNGIGIYKLNSLNNCNYSASYYCKKCNGQRCLEDNDHIGLHKNMISNNCKLFINTKMVLESKKNNYICYKNFIKNLQKIPTIQKNPLKYVFYTKIVEQNDLWLNFSSNLGNFENIISNFTSNNIFTFCLYENNFYSNNLINNNVTKYVGDLSKNINNFILKKLDSSLISFIHIDFNNYHETKKVFEKFHKKIKNGCIIVIDKFINFNDYLLNDLHAFYEFTQKYDIHFEYIGINESYILNPTNTQNINTNVAIKIINNPYISNIEITSDFYKYEDDYICFDWIKYIEMNSDIIHIKHKEDAWNHWINYGKNEGRQYFSKNTETLDIKTNVLNDESEKNNFDWVTYIELNIDISHVKTKEEAWDHWIHHGKNEGRKCKKDIQIYDPVLKPIEDEKNTFNWKKYILKNEDLKNFKTKDEAWDHWINHGKKEGRIFYIKPKYDLKKNFDWKSYIEINNDLSHLKTETEAWEHWINFGKNEGRNTIDTDFIKFSNFDWKYYIENNSDLNHIKTKEDAWEHWFNYGKNENRLFKKKLKKIEFIF